MKFSLFAHMEQEQGVKPAPHDKLYGEFVELCKMADEGGMRALWTGEHHGMDFTIAPNPFITIADVAQRTKHLRLGTGTIVAPFWHPVKLAGEAAMTDIVTGGRLELGIARGAYSYEYERLMPGMDAWEAGQRMRETALTLPKLWSGDYEHSGEFYSFPSTTSSPPPKQKDGPPIWIAARDPNSHAFAVDNGFHVQVTPLWQGDGEIEELMKRFNTACENAKRRPNIMLLHHAHITKTKDDIDDAAKRLSSFYCYFMSWFKNEREVRKSSIARLSAAEMSAMSIVSPSAMKDNLAIGTAKQMVSRLKRYEDMGYDEYSYWIDSGMPHAMKRDSLSRFLDEVLPAFS